MTDKPNKKTADVGPSALSDGLEVSAGGPWGPVLADALYQRAVGVCVGGFIPTNAEDTKGVISLACNREFISKARYDEVIRPAIEKLQAEIERLTSNAELRREP